MAGSVRHQYEAMVQAGDVAPHPRQRALAARLDRVLVGLATQRARSKRSALGWLFARGPRPEPVAGLYIWGPVGSGKTMLLDLFHQAAPVARKRRTHFHAFMDDVHARLHARREAQRRGEAAGEDPIAPVAAAIAGESRLLSFDELSITDIADAMIVGRLFERLMGNGVVIVATSNVAPDALYEGGLNRDLFAPFIRLLKERMDVFHLEVGNDYREALAASQSLYIVPPGPAADARLADHFAHLTGQGRGSPEAVKSRGRSIPVPEAARGVARFSFADLCARPLSAGDHLRIARAFHTIILSGIPVMGRARREEAKRFINLVDTLYDQGVRLIASAEAEPEALWQGGDGFETLEFARTASRLKEMRSAAYRGRIGDRPSGRKDRFA